MSFQYKSLVVLITVFFSFTSLGYADSTKIFSDNFDTFENMLKSSDAIIIGSVVNSSLKRVQYNSKEKIFRCSEIAVEKIVHSKIKNVPFSIVLETYEGDYYNNSIHGLAFEPPTFVPGNEFIALLQGDRNGFRLIYDSCGKIDIKNDMVVYCNEPLESYIEKIKNFVTGETASFECQTYGLYSTYKTHSEENIHVGKAAKTTEYNAIKNLYHVGSNAYFRPSSVKSQINMQLRINPTGARDADSVAIPFDTLKTLVTNALNSWIIHDTNITFTVHPDSFPNTWQSSVDGLYTITFENGPDWMDNCGGDIRINPNLKWHLPGQAGSPKFYRTIAHEIGHTVGLADMGSGCELPNTCHQGANADTIDANYNLMWHTGATTRIDIESPQDGDKAGAVYCVPNPSGTLQFNEVWSDNFDDSNQSMVINSNVTIPQGKTLEIASGSIIKFASGVNLSVYGTLTFDPYLGVGDRRFTSTGAGTYWSGIDIKSTGVMNVNCSITIEYANCGIDIENASGLSNGSNIITIKNCTQAGIGVNNCSPTLQKIYCWNVSNSTYQNGGITVTGSSASPTINHCTVKGNSGTDGTYHGITVGTSSTGTDVVDCDIQNNIYSHSIQVNSSCLINLNEAAPGNNIVRRNTDVKAINNPSTGAIDARYNWWGVNPPTDALFSFPANVTYTFAQSDTVPGSGAHKPVIFDSPDKLACARQYEMNGDYREALRLYNEILGEENNIYKRKYVVSAMLRCTDKYDRNYSGLRAVLAKELADTTFSYRAPLDFIESDILVREGKYREAVDSFKSKLEKYRGTYMEVEMLGRIAQMYGDYLGNKAEAAIYAEQAAAVNPGQETLRYAFEAAGVAYNPIEHENRFALDYTGSVNPQPEPTPLEQDAREFVSVSPNPANPLTSFTYSIKNPSNVKLTIYSINGQKVATLVDGPMSVGAHSVKFNGSRYASGVYFYRFESAGLKKTGKMLLLK
jgi:tetratricopeptide (TPR) repeat protein